MAKVKIVGIEKLASKLNADMSIAARKLIRDPGLREKIGNIVVADIKANVDMGAAAPATIKSRKYLEKFNSTDPAYRQERVRAVFSGQLLEDLRTNVKAITTELSFEVSHSDKKHKGYKTKNGRTKSNSFSKISGWLVDDLGYDYFQLSVKAREAITIEVQNLLYEIISGQKAR